MEEKDVLVYVDARLDKLSSDDEFDGSIGVNPTLPQVSLSFELPLGYMAAGFELGESGATSSSSVAGNVDTVLFVNVPKLNPGDPVPNWSSSIIEGSSSKTGSRDIDIDGRLPPPNLIASCRTAVIHSSISSADSNTINMTEWAAFAAPTLPRNVTLETKLCRLLKEPVSGVIALSSPFVICNTHGRPGMMSLAKAKDPVVS